MGSYDETEVCELVGLYIMSNLSKVDRDLCRDNRLVILRNKNGKETERMRTHEQTHIIHIINFTIAYFTLTPHAIIHPKILLSFQKPSKKDCQKIHQTKKHLVLTNQNTKNRLDSTPV